MRLLALATLVLLSGCASVTPVTQQLLDCGAAGLQPLLATEVNLVEQDLASGTWNAQTLLNAALSDAGPIVVCAVQEVVTDLSTGAALTPAAETQLIAALSFLNTDNHAALVKPAAKK